VELFHDLADQYREFAAQAADSPCFSSWATSVADDPEVLGWLRSLPRIKQQPNLVFAAARWHGVAAPGPYAALREALLEDDANGGRVRTTILARSTQTNEVGRLATLVPALALVQPHEQSPGLSLLEVGASAGLCLFPDQWAYRWSTDDGDVTLGTGPELACRVRGHAPLPRHPVRVARRAGVDLNPLDVRDVDAMRWLEALVWPEHDDRRRRLTTAVDIARRDPPHVVRGDLLDDLPQLVAEAGEHGPVVVFHSAVIAYLDDDGRRQFDEMIRELVAAGACHWISNESATVLPSVTETGPAVPTGHQTFVLGLDGRTVAWTHGHGRSMRWHHSTD
jgi:hypothetical protein